MVSLASHILDSKAGRFDPAKFKDEYELALRKLDLMEALRQSVKGRGRRAAALGASSVSKKTSKSRATSERRKK